MYRQWYIWIFQSLPLNLRIKKAEPSRLISRKLTANMKLLLIFSLVFKLACANCWNRYARDVHSGRFYVSFSSRCATHTDGLLNGLFKCCYFDQRDLESRILQCCWELNQNSDYIQNLKMICAVILRNCSLLLTSLLPKSRFFISLTLAGLRWIVSLVVLLLF